MSYGNYYHHPFYVNYPYGYVFQPSSSFITEEDIEEDISRDLKEQDKNEISFLPNIDSHRHYYYGYDDEFFDNDYDNEYLPMQNKNTHLPLQKKKKINKVPKRSHSLHLPYIRSSSSFQHIWREPRNLIGEHNQIIHKRLLNVKPVISSAELERDWKRNKHYTKFASRFHRCAVADSSSSLLKQKIKKK
jgi:hypothetical protein